MPGSSAYSEQMPEELMKASDGVGTANGLNVELGLYYDDVFGRELEIRFSGIILGTPREGANMIPKPLPVQTIDNLTGTGDRLRDAAKSVRDKHRPQNRSPGPGDQVGSDSVGG